MDGIDQTAPLAEDEREKGIKEMEALQEEEGQEYRKRWRK